MRTINLKDLRFNETPKLARFYSKREAILALKGHIDTGHHSVTFVDMVFHFDKAVVISRAGFDGREMLQADLSWVPYCHKRDGFIAVAETDSEDFYLSCYSLEQAIDRAGSLFNTHQKNWAIYGKENLPIHASHDWKTLSKC